MKTKYLEPGWEDDKYGDEQALVKCNCGAELLAVNRTMGEVDMAMWYMGKNRYNWCWRLRYIWHILRGDPYPDHICLDYKQARKLGQWLLDKIPPEKDASIPNITNPSEPTGDKGEVVGEAKAGA